MKQLKKAGAENQTDGTTSKGASNQEENCFHVNSLFDFNSSITVSQSDKFYLKTISNLLPSTYLQDIFHPPQA